MEQDLTVKIPRTWIKGLPEEELTLKQIIRLGIYQYKGEDPWGRPLDYWFAVVFCGEDKHLASI